MNHEYPRYTNEEVGEAVVQTASALSETLKAYDVPSAAVYDSILHTSRVAWHNMRSGHTLRHSAAQLIVLRQINVVLQDLITQGVLTPVDTTKADYAVSSRMKRRMSNAKRLISEYTRTYGAGITLGNN